MIPKKEMVGRGGFEPPKATPTDLQSVPFGHSGTSPEFQQLAAWIFNTIKLAVGFEPTTCCLQDSYSAIELRQLKKPIHKIYQKHIFLSRDKSQPQVYLPNIE